MKRTLESRAFISAILSMAIGAFLFYTHPFPAYGLIRLTLSRNDQ